MLENLQTTGQFGAASRKQIPLQLHCGVRAWVGRFNQQILRPFDAVTIQALSNKPRLDATRTQPLPLRNIKLRLRLDGIELH